MVEYFLLELNMMVFHNKKEFKEFIISKKLYKIDGGAEGEFYISPWIEKVIKYFSILKNTVCQFMK